MSQAYPRLIAGLPARVPASAAMPSSVRQMQAHIGQLPLANPAVAARELTRLLQGMLGTVWSGAERLQALQALDATVMQLCNGAERQLATESFPLPPAKLALAESVSAFQRMLAQGYALAAYEMCAPAGKVGFMRGKSVLQALVSALHHGGLDLLWRYRLYRTPQPDSWLRLHAAYALARDCALADKEAALDDANTRRTPRALYLHALLLAVSNPYRFSGRELNDAWEVTGLMAARCTLESSASSAIAIDPASDAGPGYLPEERRASIPGLLSFDAEPAREALAADQRMQPGGATRLSYRMGDGRVLEVTHVFLGRLQSTWGGAAERGHARLPAGHPLETCIGLHGVHMLLAGGQPFQSFLSGLRGAAVAQGTQGTSPAWAAADSGGVLVQRVKVIDQSLGGYQLLWQAEAGLRIRVGEIVGLAPLAERGDVQDWMVGIVRWMRIEDSGQIDSGIELLARQALPAAVRFPDAGGTLHNPQRALLLRDGDREHLLLAVLGEAMPRALELSLPEDPRDWQPTPGVRMGHIESSEPIGPSYISLTVNAAPRASAVDAPTQSAPEPAHD